MLKSLSTHGFLSGVSGVFSWSVEHVNTSRVCRSAAILRPGLPASASSSHCSSAARRNSRRRPTRMYGRAGTPRTLPFRIFSRCDRDILKNLAASGKVRISAALSMASLILSIPSHAVVASCLALAQKPPFQLAPARIPAALYVPHHWPSRDNHRAGNPTIARRFPHPNGAEAGFQCRLMPAFTTGLVGSTVASSSHRHPPLLRAGHDSRVRRTNTGVLDDGQEPLSPAVPSELTQLDSARPQHRPCGQD